MADTGAETIAVSDQEWSEVEAQIHVLRSTAQVKGMFTIIRDCKTTRSDFVFHANRLTRLLVEFGLSFLPYEETQVVTPTGDAYEGLKFKSNICGVSIIRSGEAMEDALRSVCRAVRIGKILIQRNKDSDRRELIYARLPEDVASRHVILMDPVAASGKTVLRAMEILLEKGVPEENIVFVTLIASQPALLRLAKAYPATTICVGEVDTSTQNALVYPGLGQFGDRYFGTEE